MSGYKAPVVDALDTDDNVVLVRNGIAVQLPVAGLDLGGDEVPAIEVRSEPYYDGGNVVTGYGPVGVPGEEYRFRFRPEDFAVARALGGALTKEPFIEHSDSVWFEPAMIGAIPSSVKIQSATYNLDKQPFIDHSDSVWFEPTMIGAIPSVATVRTVAGIFTKPIFQEVGGVGFIHPDMIQKKGRLRNAVPVELSGTYALSSSMMTVISVNLALDNIGARPILVTYSLNASATRASAGDLGVNIRTVFGSLTPLTDHAMIGATGVTNIRGTTTWAYGGLLGSTVPTNNTIALQARSVNATAGSVFKARITILEFEPF